MKPSFNKMLATSRKPSLFLPVNNPTPTDTTGNHLLFILDTSMYTDSSYLEHIKKSILPYSKTFLEEQKNKNVISLISYGARAHILLHKVNTIKPLTDALVPLSPLGFSNVSSAVKLANQILTKNKNYVIMFNNYYPNFGLSTSNGIYSLKDPLSYRHSNALKEQLEQLRTKALLFNISNLKTLSTKDSYFTKNLYENHTDKSYTVTTKEEFNEAFLDLIEKMKNQMPPRVEVHKKNPILFIPGFIGSELYNAKEEALSDFEKSIGSIYRSTADSFKKIWLPTVSERNKINQYLNPTNKAYGLQQGPLNSLPFLSREHGPMEVYMPLLFKLIDTFPDRDVYLFSYDWRQKNEKIVEQLSNFIEHITANSNSKVDLIAHSMGGIISALYLEKENQKIDKYASFGTPYEGVPKSSNQIVFKNFTDGISDLILKDFFGVDYSLSYQFDSAIELLPSKAMFEKYPYHLITDLKNFQLALDKRANYLEPIRLNSLNYEDAVTFTSNNHSSKIIGVDVLSTIVRKKIGQENYQNFIEVVTKFREDQNFDKPVHLLHRKNSLFFVGTGSATEVSAYIQWRDKGYHLVEKLYSKKGDGTVPLYSATMGINLNNTSDFIKNKFIVRNDSHLFLLSDPYNLEKLVKFLAQ